ncbi:MAG TPA: Smr/MutS family protein [Hyphomicrobium sp.]|jgi:DNA-nicking Smr family endonuclease
MARDRESRPLSKAAAKRAAGDHLSEEERALWELAARDLEPLKGKKSRVHALHEDVGGAPARHPPQAKKKTAQPAPASQPKAEPKSAPQPPLLAEIDRRRARRIEVEARIDLHGMRQSEAHAALRRFLFDAYAKGRRWVLVITGKGAPARSGRAPEEAEYGREEERGVLRRNVPRWLAEPELRAIVVGFTPAAVRHGGEGALYVQLRRPGRAER